MPSEGEQQVREVAALLARGPKPVATLKRRLPFDPDPVLRSTTWSARASAQTTSRRFGRLPTWMLWSSGTRSELTPRRDGS